MAQSVNLQSLRRELLERLDAHPMKNWSAPLLRTVIDVIDLSGEGNPKTPKCGGRAVLTLVKTPSGAHRLSTTNGK